MRPMGNFQINEWVGKIKNTGGLFGRLCYVLIFVVLCGAVVACAVRTELIAICALLGIFVVVPLMLLKMILFADKHPEISALDGREYIKWHCLEQGSKERPVFPVGTPTLPEPGVKTDGLSNKSAYVDMPDELPEGHHG